MISYEYQCTSCYHKFNRLLKKHWDSLPCEKCGATAVKVVSPVNFIIHGYNEKNGYTKNEKKKG